MGTNEHDDTPDGAERGHDSAGGPDVVGGGDPFELASPPSVGHEQFDERLTHESGSVVPWGLTHRQWRFVLEYVQDFNATAAAHRAGYAASSKAMPGRLMSHPTIRRALSWLLDQRADQYVAEHSRIIQELAAIAFADLGDFASWGGASVEWKDSTQIPKWKRRAVRRIKHTEVTTREFARATTELEFEPKLKALELLGRAVGLFRERDSEDSRGAFQRWFDATLDGTNPPATIVDVEAEDVGADNGVEGAGNG